MNFGTLPVSRRGCFEGLSALPVATFPLEVNSVMRF